MLLDNVTVEFPLLHMGHRSIKKSIVSRATGGAILKEANAPTVVRALSDISLDVQSGDRIGLVGPNGAGKTTILRTMAGIYEPVSGSIHIDGRVATLLDIAAGMNHELTGMENIELRGLYMGLRKSEIKTLVEEVEDFCELGDFLNMPIRTYSSGMSVRLAFGLATAIKADILIMDEWVLAGDSSFTSKASERLESLVNTASILVLASHNDQIIRTWCNRALYLKHGRVENSGDVDEVLDYYHGEQQP